MRVRWKNRGQVLGRWVLWNRRRGPDGVIRVIPVSRQPARLLPFQRDGQFPSGLVAAVAQRPKVPKPQGRRKGSGSASLDRIWSGIGEAGRAAALQSRRRVPASGPPDDRDVGNMSKKRRKQKKPLIACAGCGAELRQHEMKWERVLLRDGGVRDDPFCADCDRPSTQDDEDDALRERRRDPWPSSKIYGGSTGPVETIVSGGLPSLGRRR